MRYFLMFAMVVAAALSGGFAGYQMPEPVVVPVPVTELVVVPRKFQHHERIAVYFDGHSVTLAEGAEPEPKHMDQTLEYVVHVEWDEAIAEGAGMAFQLVLPCSDGAWLSVVRTRPAGAGQIWAEDHRDKPGDGF